MVPPPPPLDAHSAAVVEWFNENVNLFARDFGLMDELIKETGLEGERKSAFIRKLDVIYAHSVKMEIEKARAAQEKADA